MSQYVLFLHGMARMRHLHLSLRSFLECASFWRSYVGCMFTSICLAVFVTDDAKISWGAFQVLTTTYAW
jgi:hypothetical protein